MYLDEELYPSPEIRKNIMDKNEIKRDQDEDV